jgi:lipoate---protein ligase
VSSAGRFTVARRRGNAADLHADVQGGDLQVEVPSATWLEVDRPALVLGSAQPMAQIDLEACGAAGVDVVRRRSGGGAVYLVPDEMLWLDIVVPAGDPLWQDDIGRAMWWLGEVWVEALAACGEAQAEVYRGPIRHTAWSRHVCFDGLGSGEVTIGTRKLVGISQRRTRSWARLQSSAHLAWRGAEMTALFAPPAPDEGSIAVPAVLDVPAAALRAAMSAALSSR